MNDFRKLILVNIFFFDDLGKGLGDFAFHDTIPTVLLRKTMQRADWKPCGRSLRDETTILI
jgi:hypothetical protein